MDPAEQSPNPPPAKDAQASRAALCPYCGHASANRKECDRCRGLFEPLSRQASQNAMGPWFIRDEANPFRPGCSYATIKALVSRKRIDADTVLRGPSTRQFWLRARNVPGVAHLLGECHACHRPASPSVPACTHCGASFAVEEDRQFLGLAEVRELPTPGAAELTASRTGKPASQAPDQSPTAPIGLSEPVKEEQQSAPEAYEPIRHPARGPRAGGSLSDDQIDEMLRKGRASERANSSTRIVTILVGLAILGVVIAIVFAVVMIIQNSSKASSLSGPTPAGTVKPASGR